VIFRKNVYEAIGRADEEFRMCGDYKVWASMALKGKIAYVAEPLNFYRSHSENVRTRTVAGALGVAEYFCVMQWIVDQVASPPTLQRNAPIDKIPLLPIRLSPYERIKTAKRCLSRIADWNLKNNSYVPERAMREYFTDWHFSLVGAEFAIFPPNRWQFFLHRCRFYRHYFSRMSWKLRLVNFMRVLGSPLVGYENRHLPEETYKRVAKILETPWVT